MPRRFTLAEAQALIPRVDALLTEAMRRKAEYAEAERAIRSSAERIMLMGGMVVDREAALAANSRLAATGANLQNAIRELERLGCQVKDLDIGLLDFPTVYRGMDALLCWKLGEPQIRFWHRDDEGFTGRKPIDDDFREHHGHE